MMIDRRHAMIGSAAFLAMLASPACRAAARSETLAILATAVPVSRPAPPLDFELFFDLSRFITVRSRLDGGLARMLFSEFKREEWGWEHAAKLYATIRLELDSGMPSAPALLASGRLSDLHQWFAQHILDAWYEGIYRYDGREHRVTYERALMWDAVRDLVPVQGLSDAEYGYWGQRPGKDGLE